MKERDAREKLWQMGVIAPWYLKEHQEDAYLLMHSQRFPFIEKSRRIGKTTGGIVYAQENLRGSPSQKIVRWCEPWKYQAREIVIPEMDRLQESCPTYLKFKYYKTDSFYELPMNGSRIYLRGVNEDRGESSRGAFADIIFADEYGSWKDPKYIVNEVFMPQLLSTNGKLAKMSTPPRNLGHVYYEEREQAARENRLVCKTIMDAVGHLYTYEQIMEMCAAVGGPNSPAWLREFMCLPVSDPELLIVPEYQDDFDGNVVPDDYPRPEYFTPYVGGDSGADDNTAVLFGYYDFLKAELVVEEEIVINGRTTSEIVGLAKTKEKDLWEDKPPKTRVYDASKQLIYDIFVDHKWPVQMPQKEDKLASIHEFRVEVGARRVKIKERCKHTRRQLKVGMWKDERHSDFERTEGLGHLDAVAAAIYLSRCINRKLNPIPRNIGVSKYTHHINPESAISRGTTEDALARLLSSHARGRR